MNEVKTIRRSILNDADVTALWKTIASLPTRIQSAKENLIEAEFELSVFNGHELTKEKVDGLELETTFEIASEEGKNGKKKYANAEQRKAATVTTLKKSQEYLNAQNSLIRAKTAKAELEMKVSKLKSQRDFAVDDFRAHMAIAGLVQGLCHENENVQVMEYVYKQRDRLATLMSQLKEGISDV